MSIFDEFKHQLDEVKLKWNNVNDAVDNLVTSRKHDYDNSPELNYAIDVLLAVINAIRPNFSMLGSGDGVDDDK